MDSKTVKDVLAEVSNEGEGGRFSKKAFSKLLTAMANDPDFTAEVANIKKGEFLGYEEIAIGSEFRDWVKKVVEKAGLDSADSAVVTGADFKIPNMDWMYDFFAEAMWMYLEAGCRFDLHKKEDFKGSLSISNVAAVKERKEVRKPGTKESLGLFDVDQKPYRKLVASSGCPSYLRKRIKVED